MGLDRTEDGRSAPDGVADPAASHDDGGQSPPRPGRGLPLTLALVGVVLMALGALVFLRGQQPLDPVATLAVDEHTWHETIPTSTNRSGIALVYDHEQPASYAIELHNTSRLPVTITDVDTEAEQLHLLQPYGTFVLPAGTKLSEKLDGGEEFAAITLGPGERRVVVVRGLFANCRYYNERNIDLIDELEVSYRVLGISSSQVLKLDKDLLVKSPMIVSCPERTVNREDDSRRDAVEDRDN